MEPERIKVKCGNCGSEMTVHDPILLTNNNNYASFMCLVPSWSLAERTCPGCGFHIAPGFGKPEVTWQAYAPPKDQPRIIPATGVPDQMLRMIAGGKKLTG